MKKQFHNSKNSVNKLVIEGITVIFLKEGCFMMEKQQDGLYKVKNNIIKIRNECKANFFKRNLKSNNRNEWLND